MADRPVLHELDDALAVGSRAPAGTAKRERSDGGGEDEARRRPEPSAQRQAPHSAGGRPRERSKGPRAQSTTSSPPVVPTTREEATDVRVAAHPMPPGGERRRLVAMRLMPGIVARFDGFEDELNRHGRRVTLTQLWTAAIEHALPDDPDAALELRHRWEALVRSRDENPYRGQEAADVSVRLPVDLIGRLDRLTRHAHRAAGYPRNGRSGLINAGLHFHGPASADEAFAWSEAYETAKPPDARVP
jgi:hypothetical protein